MTQNKAQTIASALIGAGYTITLQKLSNGEYVIIAEGDSIDPQAVATFASNQAVTATVSSARLV